MMKKLILLMFITTSVFSICMKPAKSNSLAHNQALLNTTLNNLGHKRALFEAVTNGDTHKLRKLLNKKDITINVTYKTTEGLTGITLLMKAAEHGNKEIVEMLIKAGSDVNVQDSDGITALMLSVNKGYKGIVEVLIQAGANVNAKDKLRNTALMAAVEECHHKELIEMLIAAGTDVNVQNSNGVTALGVAVIRGYTEIVKMLLARGANLHLTYKNNNTTGFTALICAAQIGYKEIVKILIGAGAHVDAQDGFDRTALMHTVGMGHKEIVRILLENRANPNLSCVDNKGVTGFTTLMFAASKGYKDIVEMLIKAGVDVNAQDTNNWTALTFAIQGDYKEVVKILLDNGAKYYLSSKFVQENVFIFPPLIFAAAKGYKEIVEMLIAAGADVNTQVDSGETALMLASQHGHLEVVKILLVHGADATLQDKGGITALLVSIITTGSEIKESHKGVLELLFKAGASLEVPPQCAVSFSKAIIGLFKKGALPACLVNEMVRRKYGGLITALMKVEFKGDVKDKGGQTPLMMAAFCGYADIVKMLIDAGADVNVEDSKSKTALSKAAYKGHAEIVKLLFDAGACSKEDAFLKAAQRGKVAVMELLLKIGVIDIYEYSKLSYPAGLDNRQCHCCKKKEESPPGHYKTLKICVGCKVVYYCSEECQLKDWAQHREFCQNKEAIDQQVQRCTFKPKVEDYTQSPFWDIAI